MFLLHFAMGIIVAIILLFKVHQILPQILILLFLLISNFTHILSIQILPTYIHIK